jgi:formylglycine-generating enzyme required for sulfatase activity/TolB-like protein
MVKSKLFFAAAVVIALCSCTSGGPVQNKAAVRTPEPGAAAVQAPEPARFFSGGGGRGTSITILPLTAQGLPKEQSYLPDTVQGELMADFTKYSAISVFDRINLEKNYAELLSGYYDDNSRAGLDLGHLPPTDYFLNGSITKTATGYALQIQVSRPADNMKTAASYSGTCTFSELDSLAGVRRAARKLLEGLGVALTGQAQAELDGPATEQAVSAQIALSRGIAAMRNGTVVEALSYFIQSAGIDPGLAEAASRMDIVRADISSGNIGKDTRNEIAWRRRWVERLEECDNYVANYIKNTPLPTYLVYSTDLEKGEIDWDRETLALSFRMALYPDKNWPVPLRGVMDAVYAGLAATGRASTWKLNWPVRAISGGSSPIRAEVNREYLVAVELLNEQGRVIGTQSVPLLAGWRTNFTGPDAPRESNEAVGIDTFHVPGTTFARSTQTVKTVTFPNVAADSITDRFSIRIVRLNGRSVETAAPANGVSIMTEAAYGPMLEQQLNMIFVPGGSFLMGDPPEQGLSEQQRRRGREQYEQSQHKETVAPFYVGKYEVTAGEFRAFLTARGEKTDRVEGSDHYPTYAPSWFDAVRYCNWLSERTGRKPAYTIVRNDPHAYASRDDVAWNPDADGYRLPTEAEWEYACRAGTTTAYSFGDSITPAQARYSGDHRTSPLPVGSFAPNSFGLYDMHGNVSEWCWDYSDRLNSYEFRRAVRGGYYSDSAEYLRSAYRNWEDPRRGSGFRVVRTSKDLIQSTKTAAQEEVLAERRRTEDRLRQGVYEVGETGPAGGLVFYDEGSYSQGWRFLEAAPASAEFVANSYLEAARKCAALTVNGLGKWQLPNQDELKLMYANIGQGGANGFSGDWYWSASGLSFSLVVRFSGGYEERTLPPLGFVEARVRAVRAF